MFDNPAPLIILAGLLTGLAFGAILQRSRFCLVAAVTNWVVLKEYRYTQAFLAAWAVAILGTGVLESSGLVAISQSSYRGNSLDWFGAIIGGLMFGFGAALAGGCAARTLVNTAEGQLGGLLVLITMSIAGGMTQYGPFEPLRIYLLHTTALSLKADNGLATQLHLPPWVMSALVSLLCLGLIFFYTGVKKNRQLLLAGAGLGLLVVVAWYVTGWWLHSPFEESTPAAATITGPLARYSYSLATGTSLNISFGMSFVPGILLGVFITSLWSKSFHLTLPDLTRLPHYLIGGAMMGIGASLAGGCNIGQGISGVSTLSLTSLLAGTAIFAGAVLGVKWWEHTT